MSKIDLKAMSTEDLWVLREELVEVLRARLMEKRDMLDQRLRQLKSRKRPK